MTCKHENTANSKLATYCTDCGLRMITPPGEIRLRALEDARRLNWQSLQTSGYVIHLGQTYIGARYSEDDRCWNLCRCHWCEDCGRLEIYQDGLDIHQRDHVACQPTHIAADVLGVPYDGLSAPRLPSAAA